MQKQHSQLWQYLEIGHQWSDQWHLDCFKCSRLQQYVNRELPDVQAGFRKGRGTRDQIANIRWIIEKARQFQKNIYLCFIDYAKAFDCVDDNKLWKILKETGIPDHWPASWEICIQVRKQQLELDMEQQTGSKSGKEYVKAVYCHSAYLTYMQNTSWARHWTINLSLMFSAFCFCLRNIYVSKRHENIPSFFS